MSSSRTSSYSIAEDMHLCHVYLDISQNPIIGRYQSKDQFWSRVEVNYHLDQIFTKRPQRSLQTRMTTILSAVSKLRGCIRQIENLNPSGASEQDVLSRAKMLLAQDQAYKKGFKFDHVWPSLKDIEKFADNNNANAATRFQKQRTNSVSIEPGSPSFESPTSASPDLSSFNLNTSGEQIGVTPTERPIGVKKAKEKRKNDENYNRLIEQNQNLIELIKKNASDRARASELKEENRILLTDLNSISNPELREFLQNEQNRIMQKRTQAQRPQHREYGEGSQYQGSQGEGSQDQSQGSQYQGSQGDGSQYYYPHFPDY